ncbi:MAG: rhomboid family intramembrane serine protease [Candidatus Binatia bacterium]
MIPIRDNVPSATFPFVTWTLIAVNVAVFGYEAQLGGAVERFFDEFGLVPVRFHSSDDALARWLPVFTSMFLHGGLAHLVGNMLYLHIFGDNVEDRMGHGRFLGFYVFCGLVAALAQTLLFPTSRLPMVGASGAIAGVTGAYFVNFPTARVLTVVPIFFYVQVFYVPAIVFLLLWFVMQLAYGAAAIGVEGADAGGVAWWAHVGGFVAGMILGRLLVRRRR